MTLATIHGRRLALRVLDIQRLRMLLDAAGLTVADRRSSNLLVAALADARRIDLSTLMDLLSRDELKAMCRALELPDDGREKAPIVERLLGTPVEEPEGEDEPPPPPTKPWRPHVLDLLRRDELAEAVERLELVVGDRRVHQNLREGLDASGAPLQVILENVPRARLKEICRTLGLDDSGREKAPIALRIAEGASGDPESTEDEPESPAATPDGPEAVADLVPGLSVEAPNGYWPAEATIALGGETIPVDLYVRVIGGTGRNPLERRFQNPASRRAIEPSDGRPCLLFGLWLEQGTERAVLVAFDAYRRRDKTTRFSLFMPLSMLEEAADVGFKSHTTSSGEPIYAFRPQGLGRYLKAFARDQHWGDLDPGPWARPSPSARQPAAVEVPAPADATDKIEIRPKSGMYAAFARLNYKAWFALAEFVDNAVQSFLANRERIVAAGGLGPLVVDIDLEGDQLSVTDRAAGIRLEDFARAFSPAMPPADPSGLSEFGLGMKAAACWFANEWSVRTSALGEPVEREVHFDVAEITLADLNELPIQHSDSPAEAHFTVVTLKRLRVVPKGSTLTKIKEHLASIYRLLIQDGTVRIRVTVNGKTEELGYEQPQLLTAPFYATPEAEPVLWRRDLAVEISPGRTVTGWAGIMESGKHSRAGFSVFRRRRLIEGSVGEAYFPRAVFGSHNSFASQRIVGELYVEGFDVTHTKDGIQWGDDEQDIAYAVRTQLDDEALPIRDQAEGYRAKKSASLLPPSFGSDGLDAAIGPKNGVVLQVGEASEEPAPDEPAATALTPSPSALQHRTFTVQAGDDKEWSVRVELVRDPPAPWLDASLAKNEEGEHLQVRINLAHPFSEKHINDNERALGPIVRLAVALAIGEAQARDQAVKFAGTIRRNANKILKNTHLMVPTDQGADE